MYWIILAGIATSVIFVCLIVSIKFQKQKSKKYDECLNIIKEKGNEVISIKNEVSAEEISKIDPSIDVGELMSDLYDLFLEYMNKLKKKDNSIKSIIVLGKNKLMFISPVDDINLIGYSIMEFDIKKLKFRININCKKINKTTGAIVPIEQEQIIIITFEKINGKWLISDYEKAYEQVLSK